VAAHRTIRAAGCDNAGHRTHATTEARSVNDSLKTLVVVAFLLVILWNLGSALYYLLVDRGQSKRTVNALTRRIGLSVALILLVILGIWTGVIQPHGVAR
jgi:small neutral amino acid transporter SnatA (MarC family)